MLLDDQLAPPVQHALVRLCVSLLLNITSPKQVTLKQREQQNNIDLRVAAVPGTTGRFVHYLTFVQDLEMTIVGRRMVRLRSQRSKCF